jgi:hypothetical protein
MLISEALEGKYVKSSKGQGLIQFANRRHDCAEPDGYYAYAVQVRPYWNSNLNYQKPDFYTTIYVGIDE